MNGSLSQRISQKSNYRETQVDGLLEKAETFARGVLESVQALAGTTACKGVQIARLKEWAIENACWVDSMDELGTFVDRGSENEVYLSKGNSQSGSQDYQAINEMFDYLFPYKAYCKVKPYALRHLTHRVTGANT